MDDNQVTSRLEELGDSQVRLLLSSGGMPSGWQRVALPWLAAKEQQQRDRNEASQAEQNRTARSAKKAAWIAAIAAIAAVIMATVSILIAWVSWRWPHE